MKKPKRLYENIKSLYRVIKRTWSLYKESKVGLVGLGILLAFLVMAIFAPVITQFTTDFLAPYQDVFAGDSVLKTLPTEHHWQQPLGIVRQEMLGGNITLTHILVYSMEGKALLFPISKKIGVGGKTCIDIGNKSIYPIPKNITYMTHIFSPAPCDLDLFFAVSTDTFYVLNNKFEVDSKFNLSFEPKFYSEVWNSYPAKGSAIFAVADDHNIFLYSISAKTDITTGKVRSSTCNSTLTVKRNITIVAAPLTIFIPSEENGTIMVLPTDTGLIAYNLSATNLTGTGLRGYVDIKIGEQLWSANFTIDDKTYRPTDNNSATFPYPGAEQLQFGKERIIVATKENYLLSFNRINGTLNWKREFIIPSIRECKLQGIFPTERAGAEGILVTAVFNGKGILANIDLETGNVRDYYSRFNVTEGAINNIPSYVSPLRMYLISTTAGNVYLMSESMKPKASFSIPRGALTPVVFLGNIFEKRSDVGNYLGIITGDNQLYVDSLTGIYLAPLPPGRYPSGNYYILGTDEAGHDLFAWIVYGTRAELIVGVSAALVAVLLGTAIGIIAGYLGGVVDEIISRIIDVFLCLPALVIMILLAAVLGPSIWNVVWIIAIIAWAGIARVIRSVAMSLKSKLYIDAGRVSGASSLRIFFVYMFPNTLPFTFYYMTITTSGAILIEAALAFLGFGDPTAVTWGMMLQYIRLSGYTLTAPWWLLPPGIAITLLSLSFYLIGRGFDEIINPRLRKR